MKNILMNTEMTKAILDGKKTQTRRVVKIKKLGKIDGAEDGCLKVSRNYRIMIENYKIPFENIIEQFSRYQKNEVIWVREPAKIDMCFTEEIHFHYLADNKTSKLNIPKRFIKDGFVADWMAHCNGVPNGCIKEMARIFLKITDVRVEKLQDISDEEILKEGINPFITWEHKPHEKKQSIMIGGEFTLLWNKTAPKGYKWEDNPYVFVYAFERIEKENNV